MDDVLRSLRHILESNKQSIIELDIAIAAEKNEKKLVEINVDQLNKGLLSTGEKITPDYSPSYAAKKGFKTPNLKLEGDFQRGIGIERRNDFLVYDSTDFKSDKLIKKYSENIFGIAPQNRQKEYDFLDKDLKLIIDKRYSNGIK